MDGVDELRPWKRLHSHLSARSYHGNNSIYNPTKPTPETSCQTVANDTVCVERFRSGDGDERKALCFNATIDDSPYTGAPNVTYLQGTQPGTNWTTTRWDAKTIFGNSEFVQGAPTYFDCKSTSTGTNRGNWRCTPATNTTEDEYLCTTVQGKNVCKTMCNSGSASFTISRPVTECPINETTTLPACDYAFHQTYKCIYNDPVMGENLCPEDLLRRRIVCFGVNHGGIGTAMILFTLISLMWTKKPKSTTGFAFGLFRQMAGVAFQWYVWIRATMMCGATRWMDGMFAGTVALSTFLSACIITGLVNAGFERDEENDDNDSGRKERPPSPSSEPVAHAKQAKMDKSTTLGAEYSPISRRYPDDPHLSNFQQTEYHDNQHHWTSPNPYDQYPVRQQLNPPYDPRSHYPPSDFREAAEYDRHIPLQVVHTTYIHQIHQTPDNRPNSPSDKSTHANTDRSPDTNEPNDKESVAKIDRPPLTKSQRRLTQLADWMVIFMYIAVLALFVYAIVGGIAIGITGELHAANTTMHKVFLGCAIVTIIAALCLVCKAPGFILTVLPVVGAITIGVAIWIPAVVTGDMSGVKQFEGNPWMAGLFSTGNGIVATGGFV